MARVFLTFIFLVSAAITNYTFAETSPNPTAGQVPPPPPPSAGLPPPEMMQVPAPEMNQVPAPPPTAGGELPKPPPVSNPTAPSTAPTNTPSAVPSSPAAPPSLEEKLHKISNLTPNCKKLEKSIFNCEKLECKYNDIVDMQPADYKIIVEGPNKKLCKVSLVFENGDVTKTNTFNLTKLEKNNLAAFMKEFLKSPESKVTRSISCCSESRTIKKYCEVTLGGKKFLDILDDRPYFGCDGTKLFEVEQLVIPKPKL